MVRRQNFQTIAWLNDLNNRKLLNLEPPYQRRSVWNQKYKEYFIDTILLNYPVPAIFLYEEIADNGIAKYNVVDGKQRLTALFEFLNNTFPVSETAVKVEFRGKYFEELDAEIRNQVWSYSVLVEYLPTADESIINNIFDRINKNVAKLTPQELRHAKYSGDFISSVEECTDYINNEFSYEVPRIASQSRKQMKDCEFTAQLLLLLKDEGFKTYKGDDLDLIYSNLDEDWEERKSIEKEFKEIIGIIKSIILKDESNAIKTKFKTQVDFYTLFSSIYSFKKENNINIDATKESLLQFISEYGDKENRAEKEELNNYYIYSQTGVNRPKARLTRQDTLLEYIK